MLCSWDQEGRGKSHIAQAIGQCAIQQNCRVLYRETHVLLDNLAEAVAEGTRKEFMDEMSSVPLLIIDDFGMRKLLHTAAEDLLEIIMRRYERASTLLTSNRPVEDWGKLLGDVAARAEMRSAQLANQDCGGEFGREISDPARGLCPCDHKHQNQNLSAEGQNQGNHRPSRWSDRSCSCAEEKRNLRHMAVAR